MSDVRLTDYKNQSILCVLLNKKSLIALILHRLKKSLMDFHFLQILQRLGETSVAPFHRANIQEMHYACMV